MRLAFTHPYSWPEVRRGAERIVQESARALAARGHDVTILTAGARAERSCAGRVTLIRHRRLLAAPARHEAAFAVRIVPDLLAGRFDAVHAMMPADALAAVTTRPVTGHRVIYEELGNPDAAFWRTVSDGWIRRSLVSKVDVYGCMSNHARDVLVRDWGRAGDLIPGGVRMDQFRPAAARSGRPTILFSAALGEARKGLPDLLAATNLLLEDHPDLRLWLSGPGDPAPFLADATDRTRAATTVLPIGDPDAQGERCARAWVTALPSVGDSFGMALIESLAAGTPIVVADDGAPPQLTTPETGVVVRPADPVSLAAGLRRGLALGADPTTAQRCRSFARQFDWDESLAPILERLYQGGGERR